MKFSTREDIDAPIEKVWHAVTDTAHFENLAMRRGVDVHRLSEEEMAFGSSWTARFDYRGIQREMESVVTAFDPPYLLELDCNIGGLDGFLTVELMGLPRDATRMLLVLELKPANLSGKVLVQTMRLAKSRLDTRFRTRVRAFAATLADPS